SPMFVANPDLSDSRPRTVYLFPRRRVTPRGRQSTGPEPRVFVRWPVWRHWTSALADESQLPERPSRTAGPPEARLRAVALTPRHNLRRACTEPAWLCW